jgi:hypothetical protein
MTTSVRRSEWRSMTQSVAVPFSSSQDIPAARQPLSMPPQRRERYWKISLKRSFRFFASLSMAS